MTLQLVSYDQAKLLKELEFVEPTDGFFDEKGTYLDGHVKSNHNWFKFYYSAPTIALALQWVRSKGLHPYAYAAYNNTKIERSWLWSIQYIKSHDAPIYSSWKDKADHYPTHDLAQSAALDKALLIIKETKS